MRLVSLPLILLSCALCSIPLQAQDTDVQVLSRRVELLERRVAELERRLTAADASSRSSPSGDVRPTPGDWKQLANWRRLREGMTMDEVRAVLGEPDRVDLIVYTIWTYGDASARGTITFDSGSHKVNGWREPTLERD